MRVGKIFRETKETKIDVEINLDGGGKTSIDTGIGFFNHMLNLFAAHGQFDLNIQCDGDLEVDGHHSVEDIGIALGAAIKNVGDLSGWYPKLDFCNLIIIGESATRENVISATKKNSISSLYSRH